LEAQVAEKELKISNDKGTKITLRRIARKFRDQKEEAEKKVAVLEEEKMKLEEEKSRVADRDENKIVRISAEKTYNFPTGAIFGR